MAKRKLIELAHARSGDKGDTSNVGIIARKPEYYPILVREVTAERVKKHFEGVCLGPGRAFRVAESRRAEFSAARIAGRRRNAGAQGGPAGQDLFDRSSAYGDRRVILYHAEAGVARITLNRPEKRNALNAGLIETLHESLLRSADDPQVKVVVISGAGSDFCSGADLSGLDRSAEEGVMSHLGTARAMADVFLAMRHHSRPVIAAVRGRALAGGCGLATACDLIIANESAQFGYPEVKIGFVPAMVMAILRRSISENARSN